MVTQVFEGYISPSHLRIFLMQGPFESIIQMPSVRKK